MSKTMTMKQANLLFASLLITFFTRSFCETRFFVPETLPRASYKIDAHIDLSKKTIEGREVISFKNSSLKSLSVIAINARQKIKVTIKGEALESFGGEKSPIFYKLPKPLKPGKKIKLAIEFSSKVGADLDQIRLKKWHPVLWWDGIPSQNSFQVKIDAPNSYSMAISGRLNEKTGYYENDSVTSSFRISLFKNVETEQKEVEGVLITSLFTKKGKECAKLLLETAADVVTFYKEFHGFYPFKFLYIIPGADMPMGGCPYASGIVIVHGQERYKDKPQLHWKWIMAHEIGHQYWGEHVIAKKVSGDCYSWLMFGMGLYLDREYVRSRELGTKKQRELMDRYLEGVREHYDTTVDAPPSLLKKQSYDRNNILEHGKSLSILSALEVVVGREAFQKAYRECLHQYGGKRLGYRDLQNIFEQESGENLEWFFDQWVRSNRYLYYDIEPFASIKKGKKFLSTVKIKRGFPSLTIAMPIPVKAIFEDGSSQVKYTNRHFDENILTFESRSKLKQVILDPEKRLAMLKEPLTMTREEETEDAKKAIHALPLVGSGPKALKIFKQFGQEIGLDFNTWFIFALKLFDGGYYQEAFEACKKGIKQKVSKAYAKVARFVFLTWMGHLKDLMGERDEAIKYYKEALSQDTPEGFSVNLDQYKITIDRKWVEERLKTPFARGQK